MAAERGPVTGRRRLRFLTSVQRRIGALPGVRAVIGPAAIAGAAGPLRTLAADLEPGGSSSVQLLTRLGPGLRQASGAVSRLRGGLDEAAAGGGLLGEGSARAGRGAELIAGGLGRARAGGERASSALGRVASAPAGWPAASEGIGERLQPLARPRHPASQLHGSRA